MCQGLSVETAARDSNCRAIRLKFKSQSQVLK